VKIPLDRQSPKPIYLQIRDRLKGLIQSGTLPPGQRLPSIRSLAKTLQVGRLTVIEAYGVLEGDSLIYARQGSGYFVSHQTILPSRLVTTFSPLQNAIVQINNGGNFCDLFLASIQVQSQKEVIDFSSGFPRPWGLPDLQKIARRAVTAAGDTLFRYGFPGGQPILQQQIAQMLVQQGLDISPEQLILTNGSQQGISLAMRHYLQAGDWVIVEAPTYHGAIAILEDIGAKIIGIPMTGEGMNLAILESYLQSHRPKLIYTISTLHNPTGLTTSQTHRQQLLTLANQYQCPILEDNAYEGLNFEPVPPPIKALDEQNLVTYIGTFSKTLIPGLRVGWIVPPNPNYQAIMRQKLLHDFHVSTISQAIVSEYLASGHYRRHLNQLRMQNLQSRNTMLQALERYFPQEATWTIPQGGLFLWVHLPNCLSVQTICREALSQGILIACGTVFFPDRKGYPAMRLNFSLLPEEIERGIAVVGELLQQNFSSNLKAV
jgi:DNA-binding transcriptional MocR family regulator